MRRRFEKFEAAGARQVEIEDDDIGAFGAKHGEGLMRGSGLQKDDCIDERRGDAAPSRTTI